jgi:hypothetical protein
MLRAAILIPLMPWVLASCADTPDAITPEIINFPKSASGEHDQPLPELKFENTTMDFGVVSEGERVEQRFRFVNAGNAPLVISQVVPACGCTTPKDWPQGVIQPGASGFITIEFDSNNRVGKIDKTIDVQANTVPSSTRLHLTGEVKGPEH